MLSKVGFFHFGKNHADPVSELQAELALAGEETVEGSLIVIPEGFNIGKFYRDCSRCNFDPAVLFAMRALSRRFRVTFVAGLIIEKRDNVYPPYSSAYLVDESLSMLLCHKQLPDGMDHRNYTPCHDGYDIHNPVSYQDVSVGTLICMDSFATSPNHERRVQFKHRVTAMCIPANIYQSRDFNPTGLIEQWPGSYVILANSHEGMYSFIADRQGNVVKQMGSAQNGIVVVPLA